MTGFYANLEGSEDFRSFSKKVSSGQWAPSKTAQMGERQTFCSEEKERSGCMTIA
jgi:hypothetical protein